MCIHICLLNAKINYNKSQMEVSQIVNQNDVNLRYFSSWIFFTPQWPTCLLYIPFFVHHNHQTSQITSPVTCKICQSILNNKMDVSRNVNQNDVNLNKDIFTPEKTMAYNVLYCISHFLPIPTSNTSSNHILKPMQEFDQFWITNGSVTNCEPKWHKFKWGYFYC